MASRAVGGLADDLHVRLRVEDHREAVAKELLVVGDEDADHGAPSIGKRARTRKPPSGRGAGVERAAVERDPLAHPDQAVPVLVRSRRAVPSSRISSSRSSAP